MDSMQRTVNDQQSVASLKYVLVCVVSFYLNEASVGKLLPNSCIQAANHFKIAPLKGS